METTRIYLNTWGNYNNGGLGFGWLEPEQALEFMRNKLADELFVAEYGEEFFIADIDNYLGVDFGNLDYANIEDVCHTIKELESMQDWERSEIVAIMECNSCNIADAIENKDAFVIYADVDSYLASCDESIECEMNDSIVSRYFDYDAFHRDCMLDVYEASNGVVLVA